MRKMGHPRPLLPLTCLILTQDLHTQLHSCSLPSDQSEARVDRGSSRCNGAPHATPPPFSSLPSREPLPSIPFWGLRAQLDLNNIFGIKVYRGDFFFFFQEKFGAIVQLCFIFLMESLSVVLLHKIDWWQQILNELPFSVSKVDVMSHAVLATLKQLAMSVQTLLAVLTLGTH